MGEEEEQCKVVTTAENFSVESYIDGRWYIQEQQEIQYLPIEQNNCVYAEYSKRRKTWWSWLSPKYELDVRNFLNVRMVLPSIRAIPSFPNFVRTHPIRVF